MTCTCQRMNLSAKCNFDHRFSIATTDNKTQIFIPIEKVTYIQYGQLKNKNKILLPIQLQTV